MPSTTTPGIGLQAFWAEGENGWKPGMDENLARLSAVVQLSVPSVSASLTTGGGVQIAPPGHPSAGHIAAHVNGAWWYLPPAAGFRAWVRDAQAWFLYDGSKWAREPSAAHVLSEVVSASRMITEAEFAAGAVIEVNSGDDVVLTVPAPGSAMPQVGATVARKPVHIVRTGTGSVSVEAAAGSVLIGDGNAFSARALNSAIVVVPLTGDRYLVTGDVE